MKLLALVVGKVQGSNSRPKTECTIFFIVFLSCSKKIQQDNQISPRNFLPHPDTIVFTNHFVIPRYIYGTVKYNVEPEAKISPQIIPCVCSMKGFD